jgi:hypothetical protein
MKTPKQKLPPPPPPVPTIDEAAKNRDTSDAMFKRKGRRASIFAGALTKTTAAAATKKLTGE